MKFEVTIKNKFIPIMKEVASKNGMTLEDYVEGIVDSFVDQKVRGKAFDNLKKKPLDEIEL